MTILALVQKELRYDDGILYWRNPGKGRQLAKPAGGLSNGRWTIRLGGKLYFRYHLVWLLFKGCLPEEIDHQDHDPLNDRIGNLEEVTHQGNMVNVGPKSNNLSGVVGVCWHAKAGKWMAFIRSGGKQKYLGLFTSIEEAAKVRKAASDECGFHKNHGNPNVSG